MTESPLLAVEGLTTHIRSRRGLVRAVEGVSFPVEAGKTLGLVGESGSGKTVACLSLLRLLPEPPAQIVAGSATLAEEGDLLQMSERDLRRIRGRAVSYVSQDALSSLNPYQRVGSQVLEPLWQHERLSSSDARERAHTVLGDVGFADTDRVFQAYPHQLSGGMRQRALLAMALITRPRLLIADEPTTALDVTLQGQVLDLLRAQQQRLRLGIILVTHDLAVVERACDEVAVLYAGRVVERAPVRVLLTQPRHPYTVALLRSQPRLAARGERLYALPGSPPDLTQAWRGDEMAVRLGLPPGGTEAPPLVEASPGHWVRQSAVDLADLQLRHA